MTDDDELRRLRADLDTAIVIIHTIACTRRADARTYWRPFARRSLASLTSAHSRETVALLDKLRSSAPD